MQSNTLKTYIKQVLQNKPSDWVNLTTHRLDIYREEKAKTEFLQEFEMLYADNNAEAVALEKLPTAYDYIRLGHPLSSLLEWAIAKGNKVPAENVIAFSSRTIPILAVLRKNLFDKKATRIVYTDALPKCFDAETIQRVYNYNFSLEQTGDLSQLPSFEGSTIFVTNQENLATITNHENVDFHVNMHPQLGSILVISENNTKYVDAIQHVRRRETISMTPSNCVVALKHFIGEEASATDAADRKENKSKVLAEVKSITNASSEALVGSSGLSVQYAIMMGLIDYAMQQHPGKDIKIIVPPNCYGGTNDQARRVAACLDTVEILDLPVDGDNDMVQSTEKVLTQVAEMDAVPLIIAEIPTNPRVEVPDLYALEQALSKERKTPDGKEAIAPVFILDQTFCPNFNFLGSDQVLASVQTISYVSGSKFPSGGKCTAGYCVANAKGAVLSPSIEKHLVLCDNEATSHQLAILAQQLPSMLQRIKDAYVNTRSFVDFIEATLPAANINFVSHELADAGFTPSVFSLDLPTKGDSPEERENYKRELNLKLINMMIEQIPDESKYCVSYGQLKGCYWTIPATSTQGTTKEADKDYIARVSVSPNLDLEKHKAVFKEFVERV